MKCLKAIFLVACGFVTTGLNANELVPISIDGVEYQLQPGMTLERVVPESLVKWPVVVDWDSAGRLVVVEAGGAFKPIVKSNSQLLDKIIRLEDTDGDGIFDKRILAADKLPFTEGVLCLGKDILAAAPPYIWKLTDNDGDGFCEEREVWFDGQTITGCANDLHGPYLGNDGWIYWCKGAKAEQTHELTDGSQLKDRAAHIFRRRLEGGRIESVISGGMENLVEVAFTPTGDTFFSSTFLQLPADGKRDGLGHAVYGSVFGRPHAVVGPTQVARTGPLAPVLTHMGPAAPSGLICLRTGGQSLLPNFAKSNDSVLVAAQFNLHRVSAHRLELDGAGYRTVDQVLLASEQVDFHPTDILEDKSGDLLIIDTGGWYDLCCPTSGGDQKVAGGGIFRLRKKQAEKFDAKGAEQSNVNSPKVVSVNWDKVTPQQCLEMLGDSRPWIRRHAALRIGQLGDRALPELANAISKQSNSPISTDLIWACSLIGTDAALNIVRDQIATDRTGVRIETQLAACHIMGLNRFAPAEDALEQLCRHSDIRLVRAAVEALGRLKSRESVGEIMQVASRAESDSTLRHSLIYALIKIGDSDSLRPFLHKENDVASRAFALVALNALSDPAIAPVALDAILAEQPLLVETSVEILQQHPNWAADAGEQLVRLYDLTTSTKTNTTAHAALHTLLRAWRARPTVQTFVSAQMQREELELEQRLLLLDAWKGLELPRVLDRPLGKLLSQDAKLVAKKLSSVKLNAKKHARLVADLKNEIDNSVATNQYSRAQMLLPALPKDSGYANDSFQEYLLNNDSYSLLSKLQSDSSLAVKVLQRLDSVSPSDLPDALTTICGAKQEKLDLQLFDRLASLPTARMLDSGMLTSLYRDRGESLRQAAAEMEKQLHEPPENVAAILRDKLASLPEGNSLEGLKIFRGTKANCAGCHKLGHVGGEIGPELTKIGGTRTREALLEAILFPSLRIEQGFRPLTVLTVDGQVLNGLPNKEAGILHLQTNAEKRVSIAEDEIDQQKLSDVSIMPTGMLEQLSDQELADLLSLLIGDK